MPYVEKEKFRLISETVERGPRAADLSLCLFLVRYVLGMLSIYTLGRITTDSTAEIPEQSASAKSKCSASLINYLRQLVESVEILVHSDLDIAARSLARNISEAADTLIACLGDEGFSAEYIANQDDHNSFWHGHLKGSRLKTRRNEYLCRMGFDKSLLQESDAYTKEETTQFSEVVHPSYKAGLVQLFGNTRSNSDDPDWRFLENWSSERTAIFILDTVSLPALCLVMEMREDAEPPFYLDFLLLKRFSKNGGMGFLDCMLGALLTCGGLAATHHKIHSYEVG